MRDEKKPKYNKNKGEESKAAGDEENA